MNFVRVKGSRQGKRVLLYALSTCGWCRKTKDLLNRNEIEYEYCNVDELSGADRQAAINEVLKLNPQGSYPTLVIDSEIVIGYDEERISRLLGLGSGK